MLSKSRIICAILYFQVVLGIAWSAYAADVPALLKTLRSVGPKGAGTAEAAAAWQELSKADASQVPQLLSALDGANPLAANWIRSAVDTICERCLKAGKLPQADLEKFLLDATHEPRGRRLAYEWLVQADKTVSERLLPKMLNDPSLELRRDAVEQVIATADNLAKKADKKTAATTTYQTAFAAARDTDQVKSLAGKLSQLGKPVDLPVHYGFIQHWKLIGPFDNTDKKGFAVKYPPENNVDLRQELEGKKGTVKWTDYTATDELGVVDLNVALTKHMGAVAYAFVEITVPEAREAEIRLGCINANKAWCNGELLFENEAYHTAFEIDQYAGKAHLKAGKNAVLVKICQNEQTDSWAQDWKFQLRICDKLGTAILSTDRPPTPEKPAKETKPAEGK